jgi:Alkylmercury lyase
VSARAERAEVVQRALSSAGIAPERFGPARLAQLDERARALYRWILAAFAGGAPPQIDELGERASALDLPLEETLDLFARLDLVHRDAASGEIVVAYPFSARSRGHSVLIDGTQRVEAMCAIGALGVAAMLQLPVEVSSHDPLSGTEIRVRVDPGEGACWEPETAVVLAGNACCEGPSFRGCCDVLNFFETEESANDYLRTNPEVRGFPISIPDAIAAGRTVFADLLKEP